MLGKLRMTWAARAVELIHILRNRYLAHPCLLRRSKKSVDFGSGAIVLFEDVLGDDQERIQF